MKGQILDFSIQNNTGFISGDDGNRYTFMGSEWKEAKAPSRGMKVDFAVDENGTAIQVYIALNHDVLQNIEQKFNNALNDKDEQQYSMIDWTIKCLKNYVNFSGRARRSEYWYFTLAVIIAGIIAQLLDFLFGLDTVIVAILQLAIFLPSLAVSARRLHDVNKSGWWLLLSLTIIGAIPLIIWYATETKQESNQWGAPAK